MDYYSLEQIKNLITDESFFERPLGTHARVHSKVLDKFFGYKIPKIEQKLLKSYRSYDQRQDSSNKKGHFRGTQTWIGLHPQILQTPYCEILEIFRVLKRTHPSTVVDFGAAYGRVGLVVGSVFKNVKFIGHEILDERAQEGLRLFKELDIKDAEIRVQNILDENFTPPEADIYFIYDFSEADDIRHIIYKLESTHKDRPYYIVAKGERVNQVLKLKYSVFYSFKQKDSNIYYKSN